MNFLLIECAWDGIDEGILFEGGTMIEGSVLEIDRWVFVFQRKRHK
jgi:hypothetical protein